MRDIDQSDVDHWHQHGYVIIKEFLDPDELKAAQENLFQYLPTWQEYSERARSFATCRGARTGLPRAGSGTSSRTLVKRLTGWHYTRSWSALSSASLATAISWPAMEP